MRGGDEHAGGPRPHRRAGGLPVEGLAFSLRPGDKMGLVGRNGAGEDEHTPRARGRAMLPSARLGRTSRRYRIPPAGSACQPRGRRFAGAALRGRLAIWLASRPASRRRGSRSRRTRPITGWRGSRGSRTSTGRPAGTGPSRKPARSSRGSRIAQDRLDLAVAALSGGESPARAHSASCLKGPTCSCSTSRRTTSTLTRSLG